MDLSAVAGRSLWSDGQDLSVRRQSLAGDCSVDVCIVGGGFTGLWTAWHLSQHDPQLRILVVESQHVGFGASGRNGGWVQTALPMSLPLIAKETSASVAFATHDAMVEAVRGIGDFAARRAPDAGFAHDGSLTIAVNAQQKQRLIASVAEHHSLGFTENDIRWLDAQETHAMLRVPQALGATFTPHCAAVQPLKLVGALAKACEDNGVTIVEQTRVTAMNPRSVVTDHGAICCAFSVRALEGYTSQLSGHARTLAPIYSLMVATEPLEPSQWAELGWTKRFTISDGRHSVIYGQRTADDRIAFGGRGAPYHFGSKITPAFDLHDDVHVNIRQALVQMFPSLRAVALTHRWGGPLGIARDWNASVGLDHGTGMGWAGGYVGDGVGATYLAGQTLTDLILGRETDRTRLPWVNHRSRKWEPEPLRVVGINAAVRLSAAVDRAQEHGAPARFRQAVLNRLV
jgi:glycine/D-amino acid oxidase-like deaminating enzyme